ncbi:hypothetical protein O6H91_09G072800 [Diphasiastrum complanatum]|uniref:Uncharacterized protein n=1 Tax=Diphasiastrum complanatum TaxID=34168 RepID=A0ACC2CQL4_DIPCM|nr:hypothetical protein O6H91_09G072800 [Diphasiastrum complanatum]
MGLTTALDIIGANIFFSRMQSFALHESLLVGNGCNPCTANLRMQLISFRRPCSSIVDSDRESNSFLKQSARGQIMAAKNASKVDDGKYKDTIDLPHTNFSMKANSAVREPEIQELWEKKQVLQKLLEKNKGEAFTLHDGPPYANGDLHTGHALNKILKDIINRYQLLQGRKAYFVPGWDCHGLPIELRVLQSMDALSRNELTPLKLRRKAAQYALKTVDEQRISFKRYGVWGDWDNPYLTISPEYEAAQIAVFGNMLINGYVYRGLKPVHWSPSSGTALAEAELEYPEGHRSRSIFAVFKVTHLGEKFPEELKHLHDNLGLAIWTTTPWTIPGNAAIAVNDKLIYAIVELQHGLNNCDGEVHVPGKRKQKHGFGLVNPQLKNLIVAKDLISELQHRWGVGLEVKGTMLGAALEFSRYKHPLDQRESPVVIGGDYITTESGTGLVHTAPGHGQEDYLTGQKYGLPLLSPVDHQGNFTEEAGKFAGLDVLIGGNDAIIKALDEQYSLLMEEEYGHKYPYDWRTKKPTIFRATEQWFASLEGFRTAALEEISKVQWVPPQGENRIRSMTSGRSDWCISRQRSWGVPIPVFYHVESGQPLVDQEIITHVQSIISKKGSDAWWYLDTVDLLPEKYQDLANDYRKGADTMDVWFDSGSSWAAVLCNREGLQWPADLYLEGSDQHRGWFQSSLLTSVATKGKAPFRKVLTHGFVLDEKGFKMSKSLGNVIDPRIVIEGGKNQKDEPGYGADVLRLWVSSVDYTGDVMIGSQILRQMSDVYRKLRGTLRYLLSNLHDWKLADRVQYEKLPMIDKYALFQLANIMEGIKDSFEKYQFYRFFQLTQKFVVVDLSNFYFDVAKDRLYVGGKTSYTRRSCQTVLASHLLCLVRAIAPVLPHLAEDVWQHLPFQYLLEDGSKAETVFEALWPQINEEWKSFSKHDTALWSAILQVRTEVNKVLETARTNKLIGASLDAKVFLQFSDENLSANLKCMSASGDSGVDKLRRILLTSQVQILSLEERETVHASFSESFSLEEFGDLWVGITRADGGKCERCWNYSSAVGSFQDHPSLCKRCHSVVNVLYSSTKVEASV